jgi:hypothetical protein
MSKTDSEPEKIHGRRIHPAASVFPLMEGPAFQRLVDSIAVMGVQNPIVCYGHVVIDGRNRLRAVEKLLNEGVEVKLPAVEWDGTKTKMSVTEWIEAQNLDRRHLSAEAFATAAAALSRIMRKEAQERQAAGLQKGNAHGRTGKESVSQESGTRNHKQKHEQSTAGRLAKKTGVSRHKAEQALRLDKAVEQGAVPVEIQREVIAGKRKLTDAVAIADASRERPLTLADIDPMGAILKEQREQRKKRGPTKQSQNARLERKLIKLMLDIRRAVELLDESTSKQSNRRKGIADELRRLADLLTRQGASS